MSFQTAEYHRIIAALLHDPQALTTRDRAFVADFLQENSQSDLPRGSWLTMMVEYDYHTNPTLQEEL